ncbi:unnamed protein product [Dicrocoelium dendriticum]|nr:unnamed protein product [Dicrocoelium dendriticum]
MIIAHPTRTAVRVDKVQAIGCIITLDACSIDCLGIRPKPKVRHVWACEEKTANRLSNTDCCMVEKQETNIQIYGSRAFTQKDASSGGTVQSGRRYPVADGNMQRIRSYPDQTGKPTTIRQRPPRCARR